jgi:hypothetical protein
MPANYVLLERVTLTASAASVVIDNIPQSGYTDLKVVTSTRLTGATTFNVTKVTFNGDSTTSNYRFRQLYGIGSGAAGAGGGSQPYADYSEGTSYTANTFANSEIYIPNYLSSTVKSYSNDAVTENNATESIASFFATLWLGTSAINSITFTPDGSFSYAAGSSFSLYGVAALGTTPVIAPKASGGDIVVSDGTYWYHTFLNSSVFTPNQALTCDYLVVAGGGGARNGFTGVANTGGGGAGGLRSTVTATGGGGSLESALSLTASTNYTVTIGAGGASGSNGSNSVFGTITSVGGGASGSLTAGGSGGSGGGGVAYTPTYKGLGTANQGYDGADGTYSPNFLGGGGGGAGAVGGSNNGGAGVATSISGSSVTYAGGGGGGGNTAGTGGAGGGGNGTATGSAAGSAGTANTGGGGGGCRDSGTGGAGGSGIVIIRYTVA